VPITYLLGVRLFDGENVADDTTVVIEDDRIAYVGASAPAAPPDAQIVDAAGRTLLPGLIDAHVHADPDGLRAALRSGVTTVLEMQGQWTASQLAEIGRCDELADLRSAGNGLTAPGGHPSQFYAEGEAASRFPRDPADARTIVRNLVHTGSDFIKIYIEDGSAIGAPGLPTLDSAIIAAAIAEAHAAGKLAVAHALTADAAHLAIAAGIDGLAHLFIDRPATSDDIRAIRDAGAFVTPCLVMNASLLGHDGSATSLAALHAAGVDILAGTDANPYAPDIPFGAGLHRELRLLVAAGLSPVEALRAATATPADRFGLTDRGRVRPGLRADLVLVAGDPTRDITDSQSIDRVWRAGAVRG
jgi:imidazolonepropionase-like amidohydrolase